jgi:hypothetical protein
VEAAVRVAKNLSSLTIEMFEMQPDYSRVVEIGRKVVRGAGSLAAHANHGISYFRWEAINMFRIPGVVVRKAATRKDARLSTQHK